MGSLTKPWRGTRKPNPAARTRKEAVPKHYNNDVGKVSNLHFYIFNHICAGAIEQGDAHQAAQVNFLQCDTWAGRFFRSLQKDREPDCTELLQNHQHQGALFRSGVFSDQVCFHPRQESADVLGCQQRPERLHQSPNG